MPSGLVGDGYEFEPIFPINVVTVAEVISIFLIALFVKSDTYKFPSKSVLISCGPLN